VERVEVRDAALDVVLEDGVHTEPARGVQEAGRRTRCSKDGRSGEEKDDMAWWDPRVGKENRETARANYF
jgi:hypothetical protein